MTWQDISTAPRDGTVIWAAIAQDATTFDERWRGRQAPMRHEGVTQSGYDMGWSIALPVGVGGFPDYYISGWQPLPSPPEGR